MCFPYAYINPYCVYSIIPEEEEKEIHKQNTYIFFCAKIAIIMVFEMVFFGSVRKGSKLRFCGCCDDIERNM